MKEKWSATETEEDRAAQAAKRGAIPPTLEGVPTDIRPLPTGTATLSGGATTRPEVSHGNPGRGTVTIVCTDSEGRAGFMTAAHVAVPEGDDGVMNPTIFAANTGNLLKVGTAGPSGPGVGTSRYDCAFVIADPGVALTPCEVIDTSGDKLGAKFVINPALVPGDGITPNSYKLDVGSEVFLVGRKSGIRHGVVDVPLLKKPVDFDGFDANQLMQIGANDKATFCDFGDSGGPLLMQTDNGVALVGMVLGFDENGNGLAHWWGQAVARGVATVMKVSLTP